MHRVLAIFDTAYAPARATTESTRPRLPSPRSRVGRARRAREATHVGQQGIIQVEIHSANAAIVSLSGEHDLESQARVTAALAAGGVCPTVLADLSGCTFADSSVIAALLRAARELRERGGALELVVARE